LQGLVARPLPLASYLNPMPRNYSWLLATWLVLSACLCAVYAPSAYVWNNDAEALLKITPALQAVLAVQLLLLVGFGLLGLPALRIPSRQGKAGALFLLLGGWGVAQQVANKQYLAVEWYTIWKYQWLTEEWAASSQPTLTAKLLPLCLRDLQNPAESTRTRSKLALTLGTAQLPAAYPVLQTIVEDLGQDPYLQFHCLKALRLLDPQRFAARLASASDSATVLYRRYEPAQR
jgi:hypothetical protein